MDTVSHVLAAAAEHGLELTSTQDDFDGTGLDFRVVHARDAAGKAWILRVPRRPEVMAGVAVEQRLLRLIAPRLPVAVPDWRVCSDRLIAYPRLAGQPAVTVDERGPTWHIIDPAAPSPGFVESMAGGYAALAAVPVAEVAATGVPVDSIAAVRRTLADKASAARAALAPPEHLWGRWQRWLADDACWPDDVALVHNDLHPAHMLLEPGGKLTGVLDWSDARVSDPVVDIALFFGCFGRPALDQLLVAYAAAGGRVGPRLAEHAIERWCFSPALGAEWAIRVGDQAVLEHARWHMNSWLAKNPAWA